jgi:hypothetical protein
MTASTPASLWSRLVGWYYLATPLFAVLDYGWGLNVRVAFLSALPGARFAYYAIAWGCGAASWRWPDQAARIAAAESAANIALLALGVFASYLAVIDAAADGGPLPAYFTPAATVNLGLSAGVLGASWLLAQARLASAR